MQLYAKHNLVNWLVLALVLAAMAGLANLQSNASYLAYFDDDSPEVQRFLAERKRFDQADSLIVLLRARDGRALSEHSGFYRASREAVKTLRALPEVTRINSYLAQLRLRNHILRAGANSAPGLLSADGRLALLQLEVSLPDASDAVQILAFTDRVQRQMEALFEPSQIEVILSGTLGLNRAYIETVRHDLSVFLPGLLLVMLLTLYLFFRSLSLALLLIGSGLIASLAALGAVSWLGLSLTSINVFAPVIIIGLSVVMNMHNVALFYTALGEGKRSEQALAHSFRVNLVPLCLSALTTALGFLLLLTSPSPPVATTGLSCALGIVFSLLLSLGPFQRALLALKVPPRAGTGLAQCFNRNYSARRSGVIIALSSLLALASAWSVTGLKIDDNVYRYFAEDYDFPRSIKEIDQHFSGAVSLSFALGFNTEQSLLDAQYALRELYAALSATPGVEAVLPPIARLNRENIARYRAQPTSKSALATYIDRQGQFLRLQVQLKTHSARELMRLESNLRQVFAARAQHFEVSDGYGADLLFAKLSYHNAKSMFFSLLGALFAISLTIALLLRSVWMALIVFSCNFLPVLLGYGLLAASGGYLTLGSTVVIGMIIGIIVDDTIHLLYKYRKLRERSDDSVSIEQLHRRYFAPVIISSITICCALAVGLASDFRPIFEISAFSILVITLALLVDILLLPALLQFPPLARRLREERRS
ncbi:MAG: efflux RND transporter permease subunit [Pseudomonadales bacterium]